MSQHISDTFLLVKPSYKEAGLMEEFNKVVEVFKDKEISLLQLELESKVYGNRYLRSGDWISFQGGGIVAVYPMAGLERQKERCDNVFDLLEDNNYEISNVVDFTDAETEGFFLEGFGSIVLDRKHCVAYGSISERCDEELFVEFCEELEFTPILFHSNYLDGSIVLHTSSILNISKDFILFSSGLISDKKERKLVSTQLKKTGREVIFISEKQVHSFVSEITQVENNIGDKFVILSQTSLDALLEDQILKLKKHGEFLVFDCVNIELFGKHSIGSMLNEVV